MGEKGCAGTSQGFCSMKWTSEGVIEPGRRDGRNPEER